MNATETKALRDFILRALRRYPRGVAADTLRAAVVMTGIELEACGPDGLEGQLAYLEDVGLVKRHLTQHTRSMPLWTLSAAGDDYLVGRNLT